MTERIRFHTAGVRVDLSGVDADTDDLIRNVAASSIVDVDTGPTAIALDAAQISMPRGSGPPEMAARLLYEVYSAALRVSPTLPIHAAALAGASGCILLPAPSGAGKSTLAAAALQRGWVLLSDEAACLTTPTGFVVPHIRPIKLSRASRALLGLSVASDQDEEIALATTFFGRSAAPQLAHRCLGVVLLKREPGSAAVLTPADKSAGLAVMLQQRLEQNNPNWSQERAWEHITEFVNGVHVVTLRFDDPHEAAEELAAWFTSISGTAWSPA